MSNRPKIDVPTTPPGSVTVGAMCLNCDVDIYLLHGVRPDVIVFQHGMCPRWTRFRESRDMPIAIPDEDSSGLIENLIAGAAEFGITLIPSWADRR